MKTAIQVILGIILLALIAQGCAECDDKHTLELYETQLHEQLAIQKSLSDQLKATEPTNKSRVNELTAQVFTSLNREGVIRAEIDDLKKHSKCL